MKKTIIAFLEFVKKNKYFDTVLIFFFTLIIYVRNLSPSVYGGDSGDLLAVALSRGVAHPSGYPLFTLATIMFLKLPINASPAWKVGLFSAFISSATVLVIYFITLDLTKKRILSVLASITVAFTYTFWLYAEIVEVIALNSFFVAILFYLTLKYFAEKKDRILFLLGFSAGLSLTNNLSILILFLPIGLSLIIANRKLFLQIRVLSKAVFFFFLGLLPYLYIPIAARNNPEINWGFVQTWDNFVALITRQYYGWGTANIGERLESEIIQNRLKMYFDYWTSYIHILVIPLTASGAIYLAVKKKFLTLFFLSFSFFLTGPFFVLYSGKYFKSFLSVATLEKFFVAGFIISTLFIPFGIMLFQELIDKLPIRIFFKKLSGTLVLFVFFLIPTISLIMNFKRVSLRNVFIGDDLAKDVLASVPEGSVLLLRNDSLSFNSIYYQIAYNYRRDLTIPGPTNGFEANLRALGKNDDEIKEFKVRNKGIIDKDTFQNSIVSLIQKGDVYFDGLYAIDSDMGEIATIPFGLVYKFEIKKNLPYPKEEYLKEVERVTSSYHTDRLKQIDDLMSSNFIFADIKKLYSQGFYDIADYLRLQYGYDENVLKYLIKSIEVDSLVFSEKEK